MFQICFRFLKSEEKLWCVRDACGTGCVIGVYVLMLYGLITTTLTVLLPYPTAWTLFQYIIFVCLVFLAACAHVRTMLTDPGTVPRGISEFTALQDCEETDDAVIRHCHKCDSIKPVRAHHCSVCNRCIMKMDHHCPWVNNCVGENNQKYFTLFTFYIFWLSVMGVYMTISRALTCSQQNWQGCLLINQTAVFVLMILLGMEGFLFALFCMAMFATQIVSIISDETGIERMKSHSSWRKKTVCDNFRHVCGGPVSISWLSPFTIGRSRRKPAYRLWA